MTNFEKLKSMSFYEMLDFISENCGCHTCSRVHHSDNCDNVDDCKPYIKEWLDEEFEEKTSLL